MKLLLSLVLAVVLLVSVAYAGPFDVLDTEAQQVADFVGGLMQGVIQQQHPAATISWGGRSVPSEDTTYVIYCEVTEPKQKAAYYYWEFSLKSINANPELAKKYGLMQ